MPPRFYGSFWNVFIAQTALYVTKLHMNESHAFILGLTETKGLGPVGFRQLLEKYSSIESYAASLPSYRYDQFVSAGEYAALKLQESEISSVNITQAEYPKQILDLHDAPVILYFRGDLSLLSSINNSISIVGTRQPSNESIINCTQIASGLAERGLVTVSGMASGIDSCVHSASIRAKGKTIAVLASSVDVATPRSSQQVYNQILSNGGLIVSEAKPGTSLAPGLFPKRNRLIAAASRATLVIEAAAKSGALITAKHAFEIGRQVLAIPYSPSMLQGQGNNNLIKYLMASLVCSVDDILKVAYPELVTRVSSSEPVDPSISNIPNDLKSRLISYIANSPRSMAELLSEFDMEPSAIISLLTDLQLGNQIAYLADQSIYRLIKQ